MSWLHMEDFLKQATDPPADAPVDYAWQPRRSTRASGIAFLPSRRRRRPPRHVINKLLDGFEGKLTTTKWAKLEECSHDTALRDIHVLIEHGLLRKEPGGGRSTSYSLAEA